LQCWRDNNGSDNVASNKEFETEQNRAPDVLPVKRIVIAGALRAMDCESRGCDEGASHYDKYTYPIHTGTNDVHDVPIVFHAHVDWRNGRWR